MRWLESAAVHPPGVIVNPISDTEIIVDGLFSGGVGGGTLLGGTEWWDVIPQGYISPVQGSGFSELVRTPPGTPNALTYAAVAGTEAGGAPDDFYLMYAYEPRQDTFFDEGEFIADGIFPLDVDVSGGEGLIDSRPIRILFEGTLPLVSPPSGPGGFGGRSIPIDSDGNGQPNTFSESFFDVFVMADMDENGSFEIELFETGVEGAIGFGPSPLSNASNQPLHLLVELEAPLLITAAEAGNGPFAGGVKGPNGGGYSPDPIFWGANVAVISKIRRPASTSSRLIR